MQKRARRSAPRHARPTHRGRNAAFAVTGTLAVSGAGLLGAPAVSGAQAAAAPTVTQDKLGPATMVAGRSAAPSPPPAPTATPSLSVTSTAPATGAPVAGKKLTWSEDFNSLALGSRWTADRSSSYQYGDHNPNDNKLDWLNRNNVIVSGGVATFTARPGTHTLENGKQAWDTGLLTTEYSSEGFKVKTGDYIETRVKLPAGTGAWPALWTWNGTSGTHGEIDSFEYHPDNPNLLELTNHINPGNLYYTDAKAITKGGWVTIGTHCGAGSVDWYVNGTKVFSDGKGVGADWSAYPILNLSLSAGQYHPAPQGTAPITFAADYVRVYR